MADSLAAIFDVTTVVFGLPVFLKKRKTAIRSAIDARATHTPKSENLLPLILSVESLCGSLTVDSASLACVFRMDLAFDRALTSTSRPQLAHLICFPTLFKLE